jgi:hypothetical protein
MSRRTDACSIAALAMFFMGANMFFGCEASFATEDAVRNQLARKDCVRGKFKDFYLQGQGGSRPPATPAGFSSSSQNYPNQLPPMEDYPWLKIGSRMAARSTREPTSMHFSTMAWRAMSKPASTSKIIRSGNGTGCHGWIGTPRSLRTGREPTAANSSTASPMSSILPANRSARFKTTSSTLGRAAISTIAPRSALAKFIATRTIQDLGIVSYFV